MHVKFSKGNLCPSVRESDSLLCIYILIFEYLFLNSFFFTLSYKIRIIFMHIHLTYRCGPNKYYDPGPGKPGMNYNGRTRFTLQKCTLIIRHSLILYAGQSFLGYLNPTVGDITNVFDVPPTDRKKGRMDRELKR